MPGAKAAFSGLLIVLFLPALAFGQGPISGFKGPGGITDFALSYATETFGTYRFGREERNQPLTTESWNLFVEHNFTDTLSLVVSLPYLWIDEENRGLQDANLFLKYRNVYRPARRGYLNLLTAVGLSFPASAYPKDTGSPIGTRAIAFQGRFSGQYAFHSGLFFQLQSGFDFRLLEELQVAMPILFRAGFGARYYYLEGWLEQFYTFNEAVDTQLSGGAGSDWTRLGATIYVPVIRNTGIVLGGAWVVNGRNIGLSTRWNVGLVYRANWKKK